jgi:hypothetical protein
MLEGLFSSEAQYAHDYSSIAHRATVAGRLLVELLQDPAKRRTHLVSISSLAREADETTHAIRVRVAKTAIAPMDREDILLLGSRLEGVLDAVDHAARMTEAFQIAVADAPAARLAETLARAAEALEAAVANLKDAAHVTRSAREVKRLEEDGDALYGDAMAALFAGRPDPLDAFRRKELYGMLEEALDDCAHAAGTVESLALKRL